MTNAFSWLPPGMVQVLGWTLMHFLWQAAALGLLFYVVTAFSRRPQTRYAIAVVTLLLMALCPLATFVLLDSRSHAALGPAIADAVENIQVVATSSVSLTPHNRAALHTSMNWLSWCVFFWFLGIAILAIRALGGWILIERLRRQKIEPLAQALHDRCLVLQQRAQVFQPVRYFQSRLVKSPAVIGWFRPIVLLPFTALTGLSPQQLEAVIVHELAHIKRLDCFVNLFQIAVETVLFYHPAVWWVSRCVRVERENCCDDIAVSVCGNVAEYARALAVIETWRATPAILLAANSASLKSRIARLIGFDIIARSSIPRVGLAAFGVLCAAGLLLASSAFDSTFPPPPPPQPPSAPRIVVAAAPENPPPPPNIPEQDANPPQPPAPPSEPPPPPEAPTSGSYIDDLHAAGLTNFTVDQLIALKIQQVTPDYVRHIHDAGLHPTIDQLIAMRIQRVTPEYIHALQAAGFANLTIDQYIAARVQRITPEFIEKVRSHGFTNLTLDQLLALKYAHVF